MYAEPFFTPARATDAQNKAIGNARWFFYESGTTNPLNVYTSPALTAAHPNPVVADNSGIFPPIYFDPARAYRAVLRPASGNTTLQDIDPANPNHVFRRAEPGALARSIDEKLAEGPIDVTEFGTVHPDGSVDDTAVFQAAYTAAKAGGRELRLPPGRFKVSGLVFDGTTRVRGAGSGKTVLVPAAAGQTVLTVTDRPAVGYIDRGDKAHICDFAIDLSGASACIGLLTSLLVRTVLERIRICGNEAPDFNGGNTGWRSEGDQYSSFRDIYIERVERGFVMTNVVGHGGGINNHFDGLHVAWCRVNAILFSRAAEPMSINHFSNIRLQHSYHCSLYINNVSSLLFTMLPPESDLATVDTLTFEGLTIKKGTVHAANRASARFVGYVHSTNDAAMRITADDHSRLIFDSSEGAAVNTIADATSTIMWDGSFGNGSVFRNTAVRLPAINSGRTLVAWHPARARLAPGFPNRCNNPVAAPLQMSWGITSTLVCDPEFGFARQITFQSVPGAYGANSAWVELGSVPFPMGDTAYVSLLLCSDRTTTLNFNFGHHLVTGSIDLVANSWTRLLVSNVSGPYEAAYRNIVLFPAGSDGPVVRVAQPVAASNLTALQFQTLCEEHPFNPRDHAGLVLRQAAAPTSGTWALGTQILNAAPAPGAPAGWVCTAAGTPGTWKAMANLAV